MSQGQGDSSKRSEEVAEQRATFIAQNLAGLPPGYQQRLGADPAKWPDEAREIRRSWEHFETTVAGRRALGHHEPRRQRR